MLADTGESAQRHMSNGAHGVVYRNVTSAALVDCVRKVARGETWVQDVAVPSELTENDMVGLRVRDRLTAKELRIVALIVQGYKNKEIATQLGTTEQVIKNYLRNVYDKIGVSDRLELALFTIHHRILNEAAAATTTGAVPATAGGSRPVTFSWDRLKRAALCLWRRDRAWSSAPSRQRTRRNGASTTIHFVATSHGGL